MIKIKRVVNCLYELHLMSPLIKVPRTYMYTYMSVPIQVTKIAH